MKLATSDTRRYDSNRSEVPKKGRKKGDAVFDEGGKTKLGTIDRVTPVSIAVAVASASVLASAWSEVVMKTKKKGGVKVLIKSTTKGDVSAFTSLAKRNERRFQLVVIAL